MSADGTRDEGGETLRWPKRWPLERIQELGERYRDAIDGSERASVAPQSKANVDAGRQHAGAMARLADGAFIGTAVGVAARQSPGDAAVRVIDEFAGLQAAIIASGKAVATADLRPEPVALGDIIDAARRMADEPHYPERCPEPVHPAEHERLRQREADAIAARCATKTVNELREEQGPPVPLPPSAKDVEFEKYFHFLFKLVKAMVPGAAGPAGLGLTFTPAAPANFGGIVESARQSEFFATAAANWSAPGITWRPEPAVEPPAPELPPPFTVSTEADIPFALARLYDREMVHVEWGSPGAVALGQRFAADPDWIVVALVWEHDAPAVGVSRQAWLTRREGVLLEPLSPAQLAGYARLAEESAEHADDPERMFAVPSVGREEGGYLLPPSDGIRVCVHAIQQHAHAKHPHIPALVRNGCRAFLDGSALRLPSDDPARLHILEQLGWAGADSVCVHEGEHALILHPSRPDAPVRDVRDVCLAASPGWAAPKVESVAERVVKATEAALRKAVSGAVTVVPEASPRRLGFSIEGRQLARFAVAETIGNRHFPGLLRDFEETPPGRRVWARDRRGDVGWFDRRGDSLWLECGRCKREGFERRDGRAVTCGGCGGDGYVGQWNPTDGDGPPAPESGAVLVSQAGAVEVE